MTTDKTKIANALLKSTKPKYSKYRLFDEPAVTRATPVEVGAIDEVIPAAIVSEQERVTDVWPTQAGNTTSENVSKRVRSCKLASLSGLPRAITLALYQNIKLTGNNTTNEITMDHLVSMVGSSKSCIKTTISRLKTKGIVTTDTYKTGRGGWAVYHLLDDICHEIAEMEAALTNTKRRKIKKKLS